MYRKFSVRTAPVKRRICDLHFLCKFITSIFFFCMWVKICSKCYVYVFLIFPIALSLSSQWVLVNSLIKLGQVAVLMFVYLSNLCIRTFQWCMLMQLYCCIHMSVSFYELCLILLFRFKFMDLWMMQCVWLFAFLFPVFWCNHTFVCLETTELCTVHTVCYVLPRTVEPTYVIIFKCQENSIITDKCYYQAAWKRTEGTHIKLFCVQQSNPLTTLLVLTILRCNNEQPQHC